jgi:5-methyltetrahydropteroyltriglutamate--homocysteine methyltransferase
MKGKLPKKVAVGVVSHRSLQVDTPEQVAERARTALKHIAPEQLILSTDCGFGRQGCNRDIAFFKSAAIAQARDIVRGELGLEPIGCPAADPALQTVIVPAVSDR